MTEGLPIWVVYDHPKDYPGHYVARKWVGETPTREMIAYKDIDELRMSLLAAGLTPLSRSPEDDPSIVETWL